jgi:hypothetical protein
MVRHLRLTADVVVGVNHSGFYGQHALIRCLVEGCVNHLHLMRADDTMIFGRFRADAFASWAKWIDWAESQPQEDEKAADAHASLELIRREYRRSLARADVREEEVPLSPNQWAGNLRQRMEHLGYGGLYLTLYAFSSGYVHGSWHELRVAHLAQVDGGWVLDLEDLDCAPPVLFELVRLIGESCREYARAMSVVDLRDPRYAVLIDRTIGAARHAGALFGQWDLTGGMDDLIAERGM